MNFLSKLFRKKENTPRAIAFVDYEYWYYSYQNLYGLKPGVAAWRRELAEKCTLDDMMIFADFSSKGINGELQKLRTVTNTIIETQNTFNGHKKDMTDFIMLDYVYQTAALRPEIGVYVLFTGDGHFQSVTKYLAQRLGKEVVIYGVKDSFSKQLKDVATQCYELPKQEELLNTYYHMIVENMSYVSSRPEIIPTFLGTVQAVCRKNNAPEDLVRAALQQMLDTGLLLKKERRVDFNRKVRIVAPDWAALERAGLWNRE